MVSLWLFITVHQSFYNKVGAEWITPKKENGDAFITEEKLNIAKSEAIRRHAAAAAESKARPKSVRSKQDLAGSTQGKPGEDAQEIRVEKQSAAPNLSVEIAKGPWGRCRERKVQGAGIRWGKWRKPHLLRHPNIGTVFTVLTPTEN